MRFRTLGRTGLRVSEIGLGTVEIGLEYGIPVDGRRTRRPSVQDAERLLHRALDLGVNFIDTAPSYGESEAIIGRALGGRRQEYVLASKVPAGDRGRLGHKALQARIEASIARSLRALATDVFDVVQIHNAPTDVIRDGEVLAILQDCRRRGSVRFIGVTTYGEEASLAALEAGGYDCLQIAYNVLDRQPEERVLPLAREKGVAIIARSVLLKGALSYRCASLPPELLELKLAIGRLGSLLAGGGEASAAVGIGRLPEVAYRYALGHPGVSVALVGAGTLDELAAAVGYAALGDLSVAEVAAIRSVTLSPAEQLDPSRWPIREEAWTRQAGSRTMTTGS